MQIDEFREQYLDYLEGFRETPPSMDALNDADRRTAKGWLQSLADARGVDPWASRPSTPELEVRAAELKQAQTSYELATALEAALRASFDERAQVRDDVASMNAGFASSLLISARGVRIRVVVQPSSCDIVSTFDSHVSSIAALFGAFPDTSAVLVTNGHGHDGVVIDQYDIAPAVEVPSGLLRSPRIRRTVSDPVTACADFLAELMPSFAPFEYTAFSVGGAMEERLPFDSVASAAIADVATKGKRAHIEPKQRSWSALAEPEAVALAALLRDAMEARLDPNTYSKRLDALVKDEAA